jgi:hypothetical protein
MAPILTDIGVTPAEERLRLLHVQMPVRMAWVSDIQKRRSLPGSVGHDWLSTDCKPASNTVADVFLVSAADRRLIVGKPTLYFITDRATRMNTVLVTALPAQPRLVNGSPQ